MIQYVVPAVLIGTGSLGVVSGLYAGLDDHHTQLQTLFFVFPLFLGLARLRDAGVAYPEVLADLFMGIALVVGLVGLALYVHFRRTKPDMFERTS